MSRYAKTDKEWCADVAGFAVATLSVAGLIADEHRDQIEAVIAQETEIYLMLHQRPTLDPAGTFWQDDVPNTDAG